MHLKCILEYERSLRWTVCNPHEKYLKQHHDNFSRQSHETRREGKKLLGWFESFVISSFQQFSRKWKKATNECEEVKALDEPRKTPLMYCEIDIKQTLHNLLIHISYMKYENYAHFSSPARLLQIWWAPKLLWTLFILFHYLKLRDSENKKVFILQRKLRGPWNSRNVFLHPKDFQYNCIPKNQVDFQFLWNSAKAFLEQVGLDSQIGHSDCFWVNFGIFWFLTNIQCEPWRFLWEGGFRNPLNNLEINGNSLRTQGDSWSKIFI